MFETECWHELKIKGLRPQIPEAATQLNNGNKVKFKQARSNIWVATVEGEK
jgi:hypothetical protein